MAVTCAPRARSSAVTVPVPQPISSTWSPALRTAASATAAWSRSDASARQRAHAGVVAFGTAFEPAHQCERTHAVRILRVVSHSASARRSGSGNACGSTKYCNSRPSIAAHQDRCADRGVGLGAQAAVPLSFGDDGREGVPQIAEQAFQELRVFEAQIEEHAAERGPFREKAAARTGESFEALERCPWALEAIPEECAFLFEDFVHQGVEQRGFVGIVVVEIRAAHARGFGHVGEPGAAHASRAKTRRAALRILVRWSSASTIFGMRDPRVVWRVLRYFDRVPVEINLLGSRPSHGVEGPQPVS